MRERVEKACSRPRAHMHTCRLALRGKHALKSLGRCCSKGLHCFFYPPCIASKFFLSIIFFFFCFFAAKFYRRGRSSGLLWVIECAFLILTAFLGGLNALRDTDYPVRIRMKYAGRCDCPQIIGLDIFWLLYGVVTFLHEFFSKKCNLNRNLFKLNK